MQRVATNMRVRPGMEHEYVRRHAEVWPEVLQGITGYGIHRYSIFLSGQELFSYFEVDDLGRAMSLAAADPVNQRWQEYMAPLMDVASGISDGSTSYLAEVFHLD